MKRATLLWPALLLLLLVLPGAAQSRGDDDDPGRLMNLAQQLLARGDVEPAIATLERVLLARPHEGFAWGLLAEALVWGRAEGPELAASWEAYAAARPDDAHARLRVLRAHMAVHRRDKFTSASTDWVVTAEENLQELLAASPPRDVEFAARIALRDLLYRTERPTEGLAQGVAAWTLNPEPLQGRISRLQWTQQQGDIEATAEMCRDILRTDPWAAEACGSIFSFGGWAASEDLITATRADIATRIDALEKRGLDDLVLGNELLKFRARAKDRQAETRWRNALRAKDPSFRLADNSRWWRGTFAVPTAGAKLFAATNRANNHDDPAVRLSGLLALAGDVRDDDGAMTAQRWRWRVTEAALASDPPDTAQAKSRLEQIVTLDSRDARGWMELAALLPPTDAADALVAAEQAVFRSDWDPWERYGGLSFVESQERRAMFVADLRLRRARVAQESGDLSAAWELALDAAWNGPHLPDAWALVADLADAQGRDEYARDADVSWLAARIGADELPELQDPHSSVALARYLAGHPELKEAPADHAWAALLGAASARAELSAPTSEAPSSKETHPLVGKLGPDLVALSFAGGERSLDELRGRVVVVDFWATWCAPCKRALPELQAAANELDDQPVTFLLVSVDATRELAQQFMADSSYTMDPVWAPDGKAAQKDWTVKGIPSTFVVGPDGVVRFHHQGYQRGAGSAILSEVRSLLP